MLHGGSSPSFCSYTSVLPCFFLAFFMYFIAAVSVVVPGSSCYALDNTSRLVDFTDWIGHPFEFDGKDADLVVRFCKDVEHRSQVGYVDFGRYETSNYFVSGSGPVDFVQGYYNGDLKNCESSFDKMGRTAQVEIICGSCLNGACKGEPGCICSVNYDQTMCSFGTEQTHVSLYLTAVSSLSRLVKKPHFKVNPNKGLEVKLTGSAESGRAPTTLSPTVLNIYWRCEQARDTPYEIEILIPVDGYDPIGFTLTKLCDYKQGREGDATSGWATFGVLSCIFIVSSTLICCGGFIYKTHVQLQHGLDALPGMTILSALLETVTRPRVYSAGEEDSRNFANHASWECPAASAQGSQRTDERRYGSI
ncbi:uncharacterized protein LOC135583780 isoform X3 [Musa acuminata AAA Group]|uniref:uncharacterized protein LOC135583780 isoform X3 n=1 Tax=Musa acuminata AAA Group TaxID=214697 RepID=UPI0031D2F4E3